MSNLGLVYQKNLKKCKFFIKYKINVYKQLINHNVTPIVTVTD